MNDDETLPEYTAQNPSPETEVVPLDTSESTENPETSNVISHVPVLRQLVVALCLLIVVFGATYLGTIAHLISPEEAQTSDVLIAKTLGEPTSSIADYINPFDDTVLTAKAAFVWDVQKQRILFNKNADDVLPLASITKLMTALVAYELLDATSTIHISNDALKIEGDSGFSDGETFSLQNLTDLTLIASSNDGAAALGAAAASSVAKTQNPSALFVEAMNLRAESLGLYSTHFKNATGLDVNANESGGYSTARETAMLMEYVITNYPNITALTDIDTTTISNTDGSYHAVRNTNEVVAEIDGLIASKTGYTTLAGGNLVVAFNVGLNHPIVVVVLGSTQSARFSDVLTLVERARTHVMSASE